MGERRCRTETRSIHSEFSTEMVGLPCDITLSAHLWPWKVLLKVGPSDEVEKDSVFPHRTTGPVLLLTSVIFSHDK